VVADTEEERAVVDAGRETVLRSVADGCLEVIVAVTRALAVMRRDAPREDARAVVGFPPEGIGSSASCSCGRIIT
jgi:hypothetical protein